MKCIVTTEIRAKKWVAKTPHHGDFEAEADTESQAINLLVEQIRKHRGPWALHAKAEENDSQIVRQLDGCWPAKVINPPAPPAITRKESSDGN
jgi:hypothetical protein